MNKDVLDCTVGVYAVGIREGLRRAANMIRVDMIARGFMKDRLDLIEFGEDLAKMLELEAG
jgi:hypothetical protein